MSFEFCNLFSSDVNMFLLSQMFLVTYMYVFIQIFQWYVVQKQGPRLNLCTVTLVLLLRIQIICGSEAV